MSEEKRVTYNKDAIDDIKKIFRETFDLDENHVWSEGRLASQVREGKRLSIHNLKFTLSFPANTSIKEIIRTSQKKFGCSIFYLCALDYSEFTDEIRIEFEVDYDFTKQVLNN